MSLEDHNCRGNDPSRTFVHTAARVPETSLPVDQPSHQGRPIRVEATWSAVTPKSRWAIGRHGGKVSVAGNREISCSSKSAVSRCDSRRPIRGTGLVAPYRFSVAILLRVSRDFEELGRCRLGAADPRFHAAKTHLGHPRASAHCPAAPLVRQSAAQITDPK